MLVSTDEQQLTLPAPANVDGRELRGDGWSLVLAEGWVVRAGPRPGDYRVARNQQQD